MNPKFTKRDIVVAILIIIGVLSAWFILVIALFHLVIAGFAALAWMVLVFLTFWALKRKK